MGLILATPTGSLLALKVSITTCLRQAMATVKEGASEEDTANSSDLKQRTDRNRNTRFLAVNHGNLYIRSLEGGLCIILIREKASGNFHWT